MLKIAFWRAGRAPVAIALLVLGLAAPGLAGPARAAAAGLGGQSPATGPGFRLQAGVRHACAPSATPGVASCSALVSTVEPAGRGAPVSTLKPAGRGALAADAAPAGYGPADLQSAYGLQSGSEGTRQTVAVIVAYDDPSAEADLGVYRAQYGLPPCTTANGCFQKVDLASSPVSNAGWAATASADLDVVSAVCPQCHIMLVEAVGEEIPELGAAVDIAVSDGAKFIDNSYFAPESAAEVGSAGYDQYYDHPGVVITASAGDGGYGVSYPAASPYVTAVGGTVLTADSSVARGWTETAWSGTGSGCSAYEPQPSWQASLDTGCTGRMDNDVSAVAASASSATPVAYYDGAWGETGGTAVSASVIAGVYAMAGTPAAGSYPASYPYSYPDLLNAVTSGSNGTCGTSACTAGTGYNGPAGQGTPESVIPFTSTGTLTGAIYNGGTGGNCVEDANDSTTDGNEVEIATCDGDAAQTWTAESNGKIENGNGMCLGVDGGATAATQAKVWVWSCDDGGAQWVPSYQQRLREESLCLGDNSSGTGALWVNTCGTGVSQQWTLPYPVPTSTGEITPQASRAVCIGQDTSSATLAAMLFPCNDDGNQTWTIEANGTIKSGSGDCLDVYHSGTSDGTEIDYFECDSTAAQQWQVEADGSLLNPESGLCLEPSGGADTSGTALVLETCTYTSTQEWALPPVTPLQAGMATLGATYGTGGPDLFGDGSFGWQNAVAQSTVEAYTQATGDSSYLGEIAATYSEYLNGNPRSGDFPDFEDEYVDDTGWWGIAWLQAYLITGNSGYLKVAEADASYMYDNGWNTDSSVCGGSGGVYWYIPGESTGVAIPNEVFLELTAWLYNVTKDSTYLNWAEADWTWFSNSGLISSGYLVGNQLTGTPSSGCGVSTAYYTYNQGVLVGALAQLSVATGNASLLTEAEDIASAVISSSALDPGGVLLESACTLSLCPGNPDSFKGIFVQNLEMLATTAGTSQYNAFFQDQSAAIQASDTNSSQQFGMFWDAPLSDDCSSITPSSLASNEADNYCNSATQASALDALVAAYS
jgi:predicted alpha-1,6-mannanase (GH76 family)